jgi:hypothetical protein
MPRHHAHSRAANPFTHYGTSDFPTHREEISFQNRLHALAVERTVGQQLQDAPGPS